MDGRTASPCIVGDQILSESGLHGEGAGGLWELLAGLRYLSPDIGSDRVALFSWSAGRRTQVQGDNLDGWIGCYHEADPVNYQSPQAPFHFWCSPNISCVTGRCAISDPGAEIDEWRWLPSTKPETMFASTMPRWSSAVFPLLEMVIYNDRALTDPETGVLQHFRMIHSSSGTVRLASVELVVHMLGASDPALLSTLRAEFPCLDKILASTGSACPEGAASATTCGEQRWCLQCESALRLLLSSPPVGLLCDHLSAWLEQCVLLWASNTMARQVVDISSYPDHRCSEGCSGLQSDGP